MARSFVAKLLVATLTGTATWSLCATSEAQNSRPTPARRPAAKAPQELGVTGARPITRPTGNLIAQAYQKTQDAATIDDYTEIIQLCQHALPGEQDPSVRKYVEQLLAWAANRRGEAYSQEASQYHAAGQTEKALKSDEQALGDFTIAVMSDPSKWKSLHNKGVSLALVGRYDDALEDLTKALELKNDYVNTWFNRAEVRYELGQYEDAAADYGEVIQRQPDDFGAFTGRGHAYFRLGDFEKALADYHRAVTLDKESAGALVNRGDTYRQLGQYEKAAADYRT
ncbi:MAG TPA: tetratricopeptide repeat protein, partial [Pirellulaceae bacterium]|nr:tetratricopeptide repeat protein [Pirellulaceae bacterium]